MTPLYVAKRIDQFLSENFFEFFIFKTVPGVIARPSYLQGSSPGKFTNALADSIIGGITFLLVTSHLTI